MYGLYIQYIYYIYILYIYYIYIIYIYYIYIYIIYIIYIYYIYIIYIYIIYTKNPPFQRAYELGFVEPRHQLNGEVRWTAMEPAPALLGSEKDGWMLRPFSPRGHTGYAMPRCSPKRSKSEAFPPKAPMFPENDGFETNKSCYERL